MAGSGTIANNEPKEDSGTALKQPLSNQQPKQQPKKQSKQQPKPKMSGRGRKHVAAMLLAEEKTSPASKQNKDTATKSATSSNSANQSTMSAAKNAPTSSKVFTIHVGKKASAKILCISNIRGRFFSRVSFCT